MKVIYNNLIPVKGFVAINLFGVVFARKEYRKYVDSTTLNHEAIHTAQMKDLWYIGFYICYFLEWIYRLIFHPYSAYHGLSFEQEAYLNQKDMSYLRNRKPFAMWRKR